MNLRGSRRRREEATIELTPLIDVVFLLLIFFLLTSSIQEAKQSNSRESAIPIDLPEASSGSTNVQGDPMTLTVTDEGKVVLEGGEVEGASIVEKLENLYARDPNAQILLRGDKLASHGRVIELLDVVKQVGFKKVDLIISKPKPAEP